MAYYKPKDKKKPIKHPPLSMRIRVSEVYYRKINQSHHDDLMNYVDALVVYKNTMSGLYKKFNPWLKQSNYTRQSFMPKEEYYEDYD